MKVHELIELLGGMNPDAEVRLASQPHWPLQNGVGGAVSVANLVDRVVWYGEPTEPCAEHADGYCRECITKDMLSEYGDAVWIVEGSLNRDDSRYAPSAVFGI